MAGSNAVFTLPSTPCFTVPSDASTAPCKLSACSMAFAAASTARRAFDTTASSMFTIPSRSRTRPNRGRNPPSTASADTTGSSTCVMSSDCDADASCTLPAARRWEAMNRVYRSRSDGAAWTDFPRRSARRTAVRALSMAPCTRTDCTTRPEVGATSSTVRCDAAIASTWLAKPRSSAMLLATSRTRAVLGRCSTPILPSASVRASVASTAGDNEAMNRLARPITSADGIAAWVTASPRCTDNTEARADWNSGEALTMERIVSDDATAVDATSKSWSMAGSRVPTRL